MNKNVGKTDKTIRIVAGLAIIAAGIYYQNWWSVVGLVPLITALVGWCPAYDLVKCSTCKSD